MERMPPKVGPQLAADLAFEFVKLWFDLMKQDARDKRTTDNARERAFEAERAAEEARKETAMAQERAAEVEREAEVARRETAIAHARAAEVERDAEAAKRDTAIAQERAAEAERKLFEAKESARQASPATSGTFALNEKDYNDARAIYKFVVNKSHIAAVGSAGAGKSTLIASFLGRKPCDEGAPKGGEGNPTTEWSGPYIRDGDEDEILFYDFPGCGGAGGASSNYFFNHKLWAFDAIIVLWGDRLTDDALDVLKHSHDLDLPSFLVRSKLDIRFETDDDDEDVDGGRSSESQKKAAIDDARSRLREWGLPDDVTLYHVCRADLRMVARGSKGKGKERASVGDEVGLFNDIRERVKPLSRTRFSNRN